jgi:hypothetical protein
MNNDIENYGDSVLIIGKTIKIGGLNNSTALVIPKEFAKERIIENSSAHVSVEGFLWHQASSGLQTP